MAEAFPVALASPLPLGSYKVTSPFGPRINPVTKQPQNHNGIDLGAPNGTPIYAAAPGTVTTASVGPVTGNWVKIDHGSGIATAYLHMSAIVARPGITVKGGDLIGYVGTTGRSTGNHLHFIVYVNGKEVDPAPYVRWDVLASALVGAGYGAARNLAYSWAVTTAVGLLVLGGYGLWRWRSTRAGRR